MARKDKEESMNRLLIDSTDPKGDSALEIVEEVSASGEKGYFLEGIFGYVDRPTANGREYPRALMEREIGLLAEEIETASALGELDHPDDGKTKLSRVSHRILKVEITESGEIRGKMEILHKTPMGATLKALGEHKVKVGVSSRGRGNVAKSGGREVVQEDYRLKTFDVVLDPANRGANPVWLHESEGDDLDVTLDDLKSISESVREAVDKAVRTRVHELLEEEKSRLEREVEARYTNLMESIRTEAVASTPSVRLTDALLAISDIALQATGSQVSAEGDEIASLREQLEIERGLNLASARRMKIIELTEGNEDMRKSVIRLSAPFVGGEGFDEYVEALVEELRPGYPVREEGAEEAKIKKVAEAAEKIHARYLALVEERDELVQENAKLRKGAKVESVREQLPRSKSLDRLLSEADDADEVGDVVVEELIDSGLRGARSRADSRRRGVVEQKVSTGDSALDESMTLMRRMVRS